MKTTNKCSVYKSTNENTQLADRNTFVLNTVVEVLVNQPVRSVAVRPTGLQITEMAKSLFRNDPRG
jgi:hypothetical protein